MTNVSEARPSNCRNRLRDEGQAYSRSGCASCKDGGLRGCPYEAAAAVRADDGALSIGQQVTKTSGYSFPGEVRAVFTARSGQTRYVVEATGVDYAGMLHIFNSNQITPCTRPDRADLEETIRKSKERFDALSPEAQEAILQEQRQSWARGELGMGSDADEARAQLEAKAKFLRGRIQELRIDYPEAAEVRRDELVRVEAELAKAKTQ